MSWIVTIKATQVDIKFSNCHSSSGSKKENMTSHVKGELHRNCLTPAWAGWACRVKR